MRAIAFFKELTKEGNYCKHNALILHIMKLLLYYQIIKIQLSVPHITLQYLLE